MAPKLSESSSIILELDPLLEFELEDNDDAPAPPGAGGCPCAWPAPARGAERTIR